MNVLEQAALYEWLAYSLNPLTTASAPRQLRLLPGLTALPSSEVESSDGGSALSAGDRIHSSVDFVTSFDPEILLGLPPGTFPITWADLNDGLTTSHPSQVSCLVKALGNGGMSTDASEF